MQESYIYYFLQDTEMINTDIYYVSDKIEGNDIADIESVIDVLEETRAMFTDISREASDADSQMSVMRIFYQANVFNYDTLYEGKVNVNFIDITCLINT
jgi:hypothetical protein